MKQYYIGLDIGGTKCAALTAEVDHGITVTGKIRIETHTERGFDDTWARILGAIDAVVADSGRPLSDYEAIGVSCGGPLDSARGIVLGPPNLPGWERVGITELLTGHYGLPAFLQNDANACALVEWRLGAGRGAKDMVFLTMGTGLGAGIISGGRLLTGSTDLAGEVGHLRLTEDGPLGYGKAGSFEGWASGGGIDRQAREMTRRAMQAGHPPAWIRDGCREEAVDTALIAGYARRGDPDAKALFERAGRMLGRGVAALADVINPERVVIGSVFVRCEDLLRGPMEAELKREALPGTAGAVSVLPAASGEALGDLAAIMAALYALDIDPMRAGDPAGPRVSAHYERLFMRYPALNGCRESIMQAFDMLAGCFRRGGKLLLAGNGGSCADCEHIVGELMKGFLLRRPLPEDVRARIEKETAELMPNAAELFQQGLSAIALTGHPALSTAVGNDLDPSLAPAQQVVGYGRPGDVLIGISTSGNARNVALAAGTAKALGLKTIALTGGSGGRLAKLCDCAIVVPANTSADVQEYHLPIYHALCAMLEAEFFEA